MLLYCKTGKVSALVTQPVSLITRPHFSQPQVKVVKVRDYQPAAIFYAIRPILFPRTDVLSVLLPYIQFLTIAYMAYLLGPCYICYAILHLLLTTKEF